MATTNLDVFVSLWTETMQTESAKPLALSVAEFSRVACLLATGISGLAGANFVRTGLMGWAPIISIPLGAGLAAFAYDTYQLSKIMNILGLTIREPNQVQTWPQDIKNLVNKMVVLRPLAYKSLSRA
jgi:hypothetical protein